MAADIRAEKSWYKVGPADIQILAETPEPSVASLSNYLCVVGKIDPIRQVRLYARPEDREKAIACVRTSMSRRKTNARQSKQSQSGRSRG